MTAEGRRNDRRKEVEMAGEDGLVHETARLSATIVISSDSEKSDASGAALKDFSLAVEMTWGGIGRSDRGGVGRSDKGALFKSVISSDSEKS
jgi:hypothetical protein